MTATDRPVYVIIWRVEDPRDTILRWDVNGAHAMEILSRQPPASPARHLKGLQTTGSFLTIGRIPEASWAAIGKGPVGLLADVAGNERH